VEKKVETKSQSVRNALRWIAEVQGNVEGCDLDEMSLEEFLDDKGESAEDYLPEGGYSEVFKALFLLCKPELRLEHRVTKIDCTGRGITLYTGRGNFRCKYCIASFPLGVLQAKNI
jgi:monoamine oxidase